MTNNMTTESTREWMMRIFNFPRERFDDINLQFLPFVSLTRSLARQWNNSAIMGFARQQTTSLSRFIVSQ